MAKYDHIIGLDSIVIFVRDINKSVTDIARALALPVPPVEDNGQRKIKFAHVQLGGGIELVFMEDYSGDGRIAKTVKEKGDYIGHFCLNTKDIAADMAILKNRGVDFKEEKPRMGLAHKWIALTKEGSIGDLKFELIQTSTELSDT